MLSPFHTFDENRVISMTTEQSMGYLTLSNFIFGKLLFPGSRINSLIKHPCSSYEIVSFK